MIFALVTAAGVAACGADEDNKDPKPVVEVKTSMGVFKIELNREKSPITVNNFLKYVEKEHYDNTIFHRVMGTFMIQGGGFEKGATPTEKDTMAPIKNEAKTNGLKNDKYTIAMARTSVPDSATSQFFINVVDNGSSLDPNPRDPRMAAGYAVFGKVIDGTETVDKIKGVKVATKSLKSRRGGQTMASNHQNVPVEPVVIESIRLVKKAGAEKKSAEKEKSE